MKSRILFALVLSLALIAGLTIGASAQAVAEITSPGDGELVFGTATFEATFVDDDPDDVVYWAVRYNTCDAGTNTVFGNVDGFTDDYSWDGEMYFTATADVSGWTPGRYCFVFNPSEDGIRLTRWFYVVDKYTGGGGQIIQEQDGKRPDWYVISFGGAVGTAGTEGYVGEMQINFHNVGTDAMDGSIFHTTSINVINFYRRDCGVAMNFTATGEWNHNPGYKLTFRAEDAGEPGWSDTVRFELKNPDGVLVYDTHWPLEFDNESNCVGTARTGLDNGNLQMYGW